MAERDRLSEVGAAARSPQPGRRDTSPRVGRAAGCIPPLALFAITAVCAVCHLKRINAICESTHLRAHHAPPQAAKMSPTALPGCDMRHDGAGQKNKNCRGRFRSFVLWIMSPTRYPCATLHEQDCECSNRFRRIEPEAKFDLVPARACFHICCSFAQKGYLYSAIASSSALAAHSHKRGNLF